AANLIWRIDLPCVRKRLTPKGGGDRAGDATSLQVERAAAVLSPACPRAPVLPRRERREAGELMKCQFVDIRLDQISFRCGAMAPFHVSLVERRDLSGEIYRQVRSAILDRRLRPGDRLPPSRELARDLVVARATVTVAYERLASEGLVAFRERAGT